MTSAPPAAGFADARPVAAAARPARAPRDPRLDFFRGLAMFIILIAHTPNDSWASWIPARWGFSDATEIFVFCSGMASAIAFGGSFDRAGWVLGTGRVVHRIWQIYWAHIGMFLVIAAMMVALDGTGWRPDVNYVASLNLWKVVQDAGPALVGLMTLTWVPNYFDVLPMYMGVLAMMPAVIVLSRISLPLLGLASVAVWTLAQRPLLDWLGFGDLYLAFGAEPWSERVWFFNPFAWQLLFFTGFAFIRGWIPAPPVRPWLLGLALAVVIVSAVLSSVGFRFFEIGAVKGAYVALTGCVETGFGACNPVFDWRQANALWYDKTDLSILHYGHFLALGYLAWCAAGRGGSRLIAAGRGIGGRAWDGTVGIVMTVGQQSLAVFIFSMVLAQANGILLDAIGRTAFAVALVNLTGLGLLVGCAVAAGWFKSQPWRTIR